MYLKKIEIYGFKSFANKVELEFKDGITAVVGPNGSGKSNIADAVRWVLGEQSVKSLRGSKMEDVIFSGTQKRKPLGYAEVSLVIDNQSGKLPIDYNEVRITRRVFRSGESEFYINKSSCRLKDIHQLFMDTGLGKEGYSIVGQGKIDEILNASLQDRRYIFEEAAGIVKYKTRKNEAEKKLDKTEQNLIRIVDIINELEQQEEPLLRQSQKAKEYLEVKDRLKELELSMFIHKMDYLKEKQYAFEKNKSDQLCQIKDEENKIKIEDKRHNELRNQSKQIDEQINDNQEHLYQIKTNIEKGLSEINVLENKIKNLVENKTRIAKEIIDLQEYLIKNEEKQSIIECEIQNTHSMIGKQANILKEAKNEYDELRRTSRDKEINIEQKTQEKFKLMNTLSDFKSNLNGVHIMSNNVENQIIQMNRQLNQLESNLNEKLAVLKELQNKKSTKDEEIISIKETKKAAEVELEQITIRLEKLQYKFQALIKQMQIKQSRIKILTDMEKEYDGYYKSVKNLMKEKKKNTSLNENIYGVVAELINVPPQYIHSIETALGSALQHIVVKNEFVAQQCIEILNEKQWGRATFLPLEVIKGVKIQKELDILKKHEGFVGVASDLIHYDAIFSPIIHQLLGRVIVVQKMKDGIYLSRKLNHKFKIVTLEGEVFNPGGSIVGGSKYKANTGILSRGNEIKMAQKELEKLDHIHNSLNQDIQDMEKRKKEINGHIDEQGEFIKDIEIKIISIENRYDQISAEQETIQNEIKNILAQIKIFKTENNELKIKEKQMEKSILEINHKIEEINNEINTSQDNNQGDKEKLDVLNNQITQLEISIAQLKQRKMDSDNQLLQTIEDIKKCRSEITQKDLESGHYREDIHQSHQKIKELKEEIDALTKLKLDRDLQIEHLISDRKNYDEKIEKIESRLKEYNKQSMVSANALHKIEIQLSKIEMEMENLQNRISEEYHLTYDLALGFKKETHNEPQVLKAIEDCKDQIKNLGNVNIDSIEEYKKVSKRLSFLRKQRTDLHEAKESLNGVIKDILISMEKQFIEQFDIIKVKFNEVFQKLFKGGYAKVYLVDPSNILTSGIEIEVQPPGKKLQSLSLLSGGERALTAIALLFAILKIKPTPFCILDEIEAALDDANVNRYASFLKDFSQETQFIAVTHRKGTMESADILYGVTMEEQGVSKLISVKLTDIAS
ncbi:chromosome segregation protein SMC [Irregularibacter muris]|uniref:Chromosome partition protein Smc n=1 Tax=Irregularibacter muris TaxID=1796619 RepID=A0AAE3HFE6_9FIRM|nr:chromosome segregation protein SMC [Irregularibacter muris]MCR1898138.1 chromosome segregation protein SMC [Irregularibacter muris]